MSDVTVDDRRVSSVPFVIEAAGGLVWRTSPAGDLEVLLIARPGRRGWSLPKGKLHRNEEALDAAVREVREETGFRCEVGPEIAETRYLDRKGRDKRVRYWAMQVVSGRFRRNDEVDDVCWCLLDQAASRLAELHDAAMLVALQRTLVPVG